MNTKQHVLETMPYDACHIEQLPILLYRLTPDDKIAVNFISTFLEKSLHCSRQEWIANPFIWYERLDAEDRDSIIKKIKQACVSHEPFEGEYRLHTTAGTVVWLQERATVVKNEQSGEVYVQSIVFDRTQKKREEEQQQAVVQQLETKMKEIDCLYTIARLCDAHNVSQDERMQQIIGAVPSGFRHPDNICVRLIMNGNEQRTKHFFCETPWRQVHDIVVAGKTVGVLEVFYTENTSARDGAPFSPGEQELCATIARHISMCCTQEYIKHALITSEEKFKNAFMHGPDCMVLTREQDGRILEVNSHFLKETGYEHGEIVGKTTVELGIWTSSEQRAHFVTQLKATGGMTNYERAIGHKNGAVIPCLITAQLSEINGEQCIIVILRTLVELKRAQEKLRELEQSHKYHINELSFRSRIIEKVAEGICVCRTIDAYPYLECTIWNKKMIDLTGYAMDEINRLGWYQTLCPQPALQKKIIERIKQMYAGTDATDEEWCIVRKDGKRRIVNMSSACLTSDGAAKQVLIVMHDITERKHEEESKQQSAKALLEQKELLEKKNAALTEIINHIETERTVIKNTIAAHVTKMILPHVEKIATHLPSGSHIWVDVLKKDLLDMTSTFGVKLQEHGVLSPRELDICQLIKHGLDTKEIAASLHLSVRTVERHRLHIRKKLKLVKHNINLASYLQSF